MRSLEGSDLDFRIRKSRSDPSAVEQAIQFLRDRILAAAGAKHVRLSDAEIRTLSFSEVNGTPEDADCAGEVDAQIGADVYEDKITRLIRAAYKQDVTDGRKEEWKAHMRVLRDEDYYVLVMAEQAGVFKGRIPWKTMVSLDDVVMGVVGVAGVAFFFSPFWSALSGNVQIVLIVAWAAALWLIGEWGSRRIGNK